MPTLPPVKALSLRTKVNKTSRCNLYEMARRPMFGQCSVFLFLSNVPFFKKNNRFSFADGAHAREGGAWLVGEVEEMQGGDRT